MHTMRLGAEALLNRTSGLAVVTRGDALTHDVLHRQVSTYIPTYLASLLAAPMMRFSSFSIYNQIASSTPPCCRVSTLFVRSGHQPSLNATFTLHTFGSWTRPSIVAILGNCSFVGTTSPKLVKATLVSHSTNIRVAACLFPISPMNIHALRLVGAGRETRSWRVSVRWTE